MKFQKSITISGLYDFGLGEENCSLIFSSIEPNHPDGVFSLYTENGTCFFEWELKMVESVYYNKDILTVYFDMGDEDGEACENFKISQPLTEELIDYINHKIDTVRLFS